MTVTEIRGDDIQGVEIMKQSHDRIRAEIHKAIVGQEKVIEELLIALFAGGHCLLIGVPGLAKTLLIHSLAEVLDLKFNRIQFTPDLMPSDITGTDIIEEDATTKKRVFKFIRGPVFANIVLADEINRTPPKTQAALLQAMQEYKVTAGGETYLLDRPFFVLATQNPIELEGTYPLPEAQLDRFMFNIHIDYPSENDEVEIVTTTTSAYQAQLERILTGADIMQLQQLVRRVPVGEHVVRYAVRLARMTRPKAEGAPDFIRDYVGWGAGPRASQYLILGAKCRSVLMGRFSPTVDDVRAVSPAVLRHRIVTNFTAESEGIGAGEIVDRLLSATPVPVS